MSLFLWCIAGYFSGVVSMALFVATLNILSAGREEDES
jgi:hypothetical protein